MVGRRSVGRRGDGDRGRRAPLVQLGTVAGAAHALGARALKPTGAAGGLLHADIPQLPADRAHPRPLGPIVGPLVLEQRDLVAAGELPVRSGLRPGRPRLVGGGWARLRESGGISLTIAMTTSTPAGGMGEALGRLRSLGARPRSYSTRTRPPFRGHLGDHLGVAPDCSRCSPTKLKLLADDVLHAVLSLALLGSWAAARSADDPDRVRGDGNRAA